MAEAVVVDAFKFIAVRPVQLVPDSETQRSLIRDERASHPDGQQELVVLAGILADSGSAIEFYTKLDLNKLQPLVDGYHNLASIYLTPKPGLAPPGASTALETLGLTSTVVLNSPEFTDLAWAALYSAYRIGPQLRASLETPMASLRVLHFLQQSSVGAVPDAVAAVDALTATPVIPVQILNGSSGQALLRAPAEAPSGNLTPPDPSPRLPNVRVDGLIRPLGSGDLKVVKQTLLAYVPGEVAHIENVLKGESKNRTYRVLDRLETTLFVAEETTEASERDTQSTDRFELKKEAEQTIKEDMSIQAGMTVTAAFGPVVTTAHGDFAYSTAKSDAAKSSSNFAHEVVDRSVTKVQKKVTTQRTTKTFHETEETDTHGVDNSKGTEHVVGVYRWVDKKYRAQVYNYGQRLLLEFVIPAPAAYYLASQAKLAPQVDAQPPSDFVNDHQQPLTVSDIKDDTYLTLTSRYNAAGVVPPPAQISFASTSFGDPGVDNGKTIYKSATDLVIPAGYTLSDFYLQVAYVDVASDANPGEGAPRFTVQLGGREPFDLVMNTAAKHGDSQAFSATSLFSNDWKAATGKLPVSVIGYDINSYGITVMVKCEREAATYQAWQLQTFDKIYTAFQALKAAYDQKVTQAQAQAMGIAIEGRNPAINGQIIQQELKKLCLMMVTGTHLSQFGDAMTNPPHPPLNLPEVDILKALDEGPVVQFLEQAFDWKNMTYLFYPYFWGRTDGWVAASNLSDPDPAFSQFLQAGGARVVLPASLFYKDAVTYFLQPNPPSDPGRSIKDRIWLGGDKPTIDDPLYKSIAAAFRDETDDLAGAVPDGTPSWEFTIPTTLVWLQQTPDLPTFPA